MARLAAHMRGGRIATQLTASSFSSERAKSSEARDRGPRGGLDSCFYSHGVYCTLCRASDDATLSAILDTLGVDAAVALAAASSPAIKNALHEQNDEAVALGLFDAPSFTGGR